MVTHREFNRPQSNRCDAAEREDIFQVLRGAGVEFIDENGQVRRVLEIFAEVVSFESLCLRPIWVSYS
jgi:hypothetical protein